MSEPLPSQAIARIVAAEAPAPSTAPVLGICLSGGGSRALTGALGALSGLRSLPDPDEERQTVLDRVSHVSSVSGGSWASVLFTFLPDRVGGELIDDDTFLLTPIGPADLVKGGAEEPSNVEYMDERCLGSSPQQFSLEPIARVLLGYFRWGLFGNDEKWRWFWIAAIGELLLKPFELYDAEYPRRRNVTLQAKFFASSKKEVRDEITPSNPELGPEQFHVVRKGRPHLVVNFNVLEDETVEDPVQVPMQATPSLAGVLGRSPDGTIVGGGSVQSFAFTSDLDGPGPDPETARVGLDRRYSLSDIAGCSSAFFAEQLLSVVNDGIEDVERAIAELVDKRFVPRSVANWIARFVCRHIKKRFTADAADVIPRYPYWSYKEVGGQRRTTERGFSDGGSFDNTGLLGMLARTDANRIIAFCNGAAPLQKVTTIVEGEPVTEITVDSQVATVFGLTFNKATGRYERYADQTPPAGRRFAQVLSNDHGEFDELRNGLWEASTGGAGDEALGTNSVMFKQHLTTHENPVAFVKGGRPITVLWMLNNRVNAWQDQLADQDLIDDLARGQAAQQHDGTPSGTGHAEGPLANFPLYTTAGQIHLDPEAVNMMAQLHAWSVQQAGDDIAEMLAG